MSLPETIEALILGKSRSIGGIVANVTIEEKHLDELTISDHPIEKGSAISDHAYKRPEEVIIKIGWSDSANVIDNIAAAVSSGSLSALAGGLDAIYQKLLDMQSNFELIDVSTGRRQYSDMLIRSIAMTTDEETESALVCTVILRHVNVTATSTTRLSPSTQANPEQTGSVTDGGVKSKTPAANAPEYVG